jgi:hypothetical protein
MSYTIQKSIIGPRLGLDKDDNLLVKGQVIGNYQTSPNVFGSNIGKDYYVAGNYGSDSNSGRSWSNPFLTVAHAMAVSHADIATSPNFANRNRIWISGDEFTENLTAFAQKTDVIGVGSDNGIPTATIIGHHAPVAAAYGARFINVNFQVDSGIGVDLVGNTGGAQFLYCYFSADGGTTGVRATGGTDFNFIGNTFRYWSGTWSTAAISLATGGSPRTIITDNYITDSTVGILVNAGRTGTGSIINNNLVVSTGITINDASSTFYVTNNTLISGGTVGANSYVFAATKAAHNYVTGSDKTSIIPALT